MSFPPWYTGPTLLYASLFCQEIRWKAAQIQLRAALFIFPVRDQCSEGQHIIKFISHFVTNLTSKSLACPEVLSNLCARRHLTICNRQLLLALRSYSVRKPLRTCFFR
jgi:hypothetical protein